MQCLSHTKQLPYEVVHGRKLKLPIDVALWPLQSTRTPAVGDYVGAMSNVVEAMTEAISSSRERQSMRRLCEKIFGHTHWQQGATLHEAPSA